MLMLQFELPESEMEDKEILFEGAEPVISANYRVTERKQVRKLSLLLHDGRMEIILSRPIDVAVNDNRNIGFCPVLYNIE